MRSLRTIPIFSQRSVLHLNYKSPKLRLQQDELLEKLSSDIHMEFEVERMEPLFKDQAEYDAFSDRH